MTSFPIPRQIHSKMRMMVLQAGLLLWLSAERRSERGGEEEFSLRIMEGMGSYDL